MWEVVTGESWHRQQLKKFNTNEQEFRQTMEQYMETALTTGVLITFQKLIHPPMTISTTYTQLNK
jgi:hypothetical protein